MTFNSGKPAAYAPMAPKPTGGTAITSAVLAFLGAVHMVLMTAYGIWRLVVQGPFVLGHLDFFGVWGIVRLAVVVVLVIATVLASLLLSAGGIQLLRRSPIGPRLVVAGSGVAIGWVFVYLASMLSHGNFHGHSPWLISAAVGFVTLVCGSVTLGLALAPATKRYCNQDR